MSTVHPMTPNEQRINLAEHTARALEWPLVVEALAMHARSSMGIARCRSLVLATDLTESARRQQQTVEVADLQQGDDPMPVISFPDVRGPLSRAGKGATLEGHELRDQAALLALWEEVYRYFQRHRHDAPTIGQMASSLEPVSVIRDVRHGIEDAIDVDGSIKESATPKLRELTHRANDLKQQIRLRLDRILHSRHYNELLQEQYFDQREGRYVIPIKTEMQGRVPGIVHDVSSSGATVFIEPRELVELNNAIKVADREVEREVQRILRELSELVASQSHVIGVGLNVLAELDEVSARASFARQLQARPVSLNVEGVIRLRAAKHPLLILAKEQVVANDIALDEAVRALIISGPNTGGKTVTLKIIGLFALMVRAGLLLPCDAGSNMAVFSSVYADIGDAQDLTRDLSSFSAHMTKMVLMLQETEHVSLATVKPQSHGVLVLLDEPVTSTDPTEGAALAEAMLCRLAACGMKVVATTHYQSLKALAQTTAGFANASVEFDVSTLSPTYRLFMGVPGGSSAIDIAGRLGMDPAVLNEARRKLKKDDRVIEQMLEDLHAKQRQLTIDLARTAEARREAEEAARQAKEYALHLETTEREERKGIKKKLQEQFSRAKAEVQATVDAVKREKKLIKAQEAKQHLIDLEAHSRTEMAVSPSVPLDQLGAGDQVEIGGLGMTGILLDSPQGRKRVRVKVGEGEVLATVANLIGLGRGAELPKRSSTAWHAKSPMTSGAYHVEEPTVVDVRGKAADDALDAVIAALDRATMAGVPVLRVIHGHGTGRLKVALRDYFRQSPYVDNFRSGDQSEGGDGVTVARLR